MLLEENEKKLRCRFFTSVLYNIHYIFGFLTFLNICNEIYMLKYHRNFDTIIKVF